MPANPAALTAASLAAMQPGEDANAVAEELYTKFMSGLGSRNDMSLFGRIWNITHRYKDSYFDQAQRFHDLYDELTPEERFRATSLWNMWQSTDGTAHIKAHDIAIEARQHGDSFPGQSIKGSLERAARNGASKETMQKILSGFFTIMFTAHPTQSAPEEYVKERRRYVNAILNGDDAAMQESLDRCLNHINPVRERNKTGEEELAETLGHLENIFWNYPVLFAEVKDTLEALKLHKDYQGRGYGEIDLDQYTAQSDQFFRIILWPRTDADGNPNATAAEAAGAVVQVQQFMNKLYCQALYQLLAGPQAVQKDRSREIIGKLLYQMAMNFDDQLPDEIQKWLRGEGVCYQNQELETLDAAHDPYLEYFNAELSKLTQHEKNGPLGEIKGLMRQAKAFGWHLGKFDIRQDARIHRSLMNYFLPELANTSAEERSKLLNEKLKSCSHSDWQNMARIALDKIEAELDVAAETPQKTKLNVLKDTLLRLQRVVNQNPDHFDRYIISNCGQTSDALDLLALLRATGTADKQRMVFLRESHADLVALPEFIREICHNAEFTNYIAQHNNNIEIMVAMSDTQRQDGPTVLFAQRQGVVDSALVLLEINRTRKQQGLPPLTMTITAGGSDDIVRGGNDPSSFFFNISREVYAASRLQGYEPDEIAAILGPEILRTDQGRDVENDFGDPTNTKKKMEQHTAAAFNWQRFLVVQKDTWEQVGMPQQRKIENEILSLEGTLVEYRKAEAKEFAEIDDMDAQRFWPARIIEVEEKIKSLQQDLEPIKEKTKAFLEQEEKYIQPFKANRRAQKIVEDSCMWIYHSFRGEVLDSLSAGVIPANATRTLNTGARPIQRPGFNPEEHKDVATSGIDAALAALALPLTDTRAITNQFAVELSKLHLQGWLGLSGLKDVSEFELYDMYNESNCFQDTLLRAQMEMMKTNFDHVWSSWSQIHRAESPNPQEGENYADVFAKRIHQRHGVQLSQQDMADMMQELSLQDNLANRSKVILSWLQKEFIETDKIIGQAQFGCEEGAQISAAERFKLYPRQHAEMMAREQTNRFPSIWLARMHGDYYATHPLGEQGNWIQDRTFQLLSTMCVDTQRTPTTFLNLSPGPKERHMEYRKRELHEEFHFKTIGVHFRDCVSKEPTTPRAVHYTSLAHHQTAILALRP